ncbi:hypothetical protein BGZ65_008983 [Modicella reniformis]|uniref:Uncharacterized protein n=1 Tax=Modicella reniformis TaxID=1440133 RepID=A0A9P6MAY3_9FUNG|nr:hypothetical protein BGZ65_008983 [Modicella reniformis]
MSFISGQIVPSPNAAGASHIGPNSRIEIHLNDVSLQDAPSTLLAEGIVITGPSSQLSFPIPFCLTYDHHRVEERFSYSISVRVTDLSPTKKDQLTWITTTRCSVLNCGNPKSDINVTVDPIVGDQ